MKYNHMEKYEIIRMVEASDLSVSLTLKQIGVSKSSFYEWYKKYLDDGIDGLKDKNRRPDQIWNKIPERSCREIAVKFIDEKRSFISESSVYRILKAANLIVSPVFTVQSASDKFQNPTTRIDELWQTDFTYFKITGWGWYYLSTIMDDYSRMIIAWKLCSSMTAKDVSDTLDLAIDFTGVQSPKIIENPRLLSDNGPCYISNELKEYLENHKMRHTRGKPFHPMTQGKIERYHRSMKNIILLDNYYLPMHLEFEIEKWVNYYNNERYHEAIGNITPSDKYFGREESIFRKRKRIKEKTMKKRRVDYFRKNWIEKNPF